MEEDRANLNSAIMAAFASENFLASGTGLFVAVLTSALAFFEGHKAEEGLVKVISEAFAILMVCIVLGAGIYFHFWAGAALGSLGILIEAYLVLRQLRSVGQ